MSRPEDLAQYIILNNCTIRAAAKVFNISKSTVHLDVSKRLKKINLQLYKRVQVVIENNFKERNFRGGMATKMKYEKLKNSVIKMS